MNRDERVMLLLLSIPILVGSLVTLIVLIARRATSCECPYCFRRIPKQAVEQQVPCPECGALLSDAPIAFDQDVVSTCNHCKQGIGGDESVRLWDAKTYCLPCLKEHAPGLLVFCRESQLAEVMPYSAWKLSAKMFCFVAFAIGCFATLVSLPIALMGKLLLAAQRFGVIFLIGSPVILLWSIGAGAAFSIVRPKTYAWSGKLIVCFGTQMIVAPLTECSWGEGKASNLTVLAYGFLFRGPAIIIDLTKQPGRQGNRLTVGLTPELFGVWASFLSLAAIPRLPEKTTW